MDKDKIGFSFTLPLCPNMDLKNNTVRVSFECSPGFGLDADVSYEQQERFNATFGASHEPQFAEEFGDYAVYFEIDRADLQFEPPMVRWKFEYLSNRDECGGLVIGIGGSLKHCFKQLRADTRCNLYVSEETFPVSYFTNERNEYLSSVNHSIYLRSYDERLKPKIQFQTRGIAYPKDSEAAEIAQSMHLMEAGSVFLMAQQEKNPQKYRG